MHFLLEPSGAHTRISHCHCNAVLTYSSGFDPVVQKYLLHLACGTAVLLEFYYDGIPE